MTATALPEQSGLEIAGQAEHGFIEAKLVIPRPTRELIRRDRVLQLLDTSTDRRVISVIAPPGYGKTAVIAQWAEDRQSSVAWLTADEADNDPVVLFSYLAASLSRVVPIDESLFEAIASAKLSIRSVAGRVLAALQAHRGRLTIVIDDAQRVTDRAGLDALSELIAYLPLKTQVAILSRQPIGLPLARWRAESQLVEIGPGELALDESEVSRVALAAGLDMTAEEVAEVTRRTEGWPALVALVAMAARRSGVERAIQVSSRNRPIADYLRSEVVENRSEPETQFLMRTSILERLSGPVCDAVTERRDSTAMLEELARSTLLVDEYAGSFRYHALLREFLQDQLRAREPGTARRLHYRAAAWYEDAGDVEQAVVHAFAAQDLNLAARLVGAGFVRYHWSARRATTRGWVAQFTDAALAERPWLAVLGAWEELAAGEPAATQQLADIAEHAEMADRPPDGTASFQSGLAMLRSIMGRSTEEAMLSDARLAASLESEAATKWQDLAQWLVGLACHASGDHAAADVGLRDAAAAARAASNDGLAYCILGHRALLAIDRLDWVTAEQLTSESRVRNAPSHVDGYMSSIFAMIVRVRLATHHGQITAARTGLAQAAALRPLLTSAAPAFSVIALIGLARAHLALGEAAGARAVLAQANEILAERPQLTVLREKVATVAATMSAMPADRSGASSLTAAELRVLALLPYYLSFKELGERLGVRSTTIKTHAMSIYGKLGATSRGEAVELAVSAGLLDRFPS